MEVQFILLVYSPLARTFGKVFSNMTR